MLSINQSSNFFCKICRFKSEHHSLKSLWAQRNEVIVYSKENWIQGGGNRVSVHFAVTFLDFWKTSFCVTTIIKIVNNSTNDKQTFGASIENRIYREELKESLGMNFFCPFQPEREFKVYKSCKCSQIICSRVH